MSKATIRSFLLLPLLLLLLCVDTAHACDCIKPGPPCQEYGQFDTVFAATVISKSRTAVDDRDYVVVRFTVEQVFKGDAGGQETEVLTGLGDGDCGYPFQIGKQYLVYASRFGQPLKLYSGTCSRNRLMSEADEDLAYFRSLTGEKRGGKILVNVIRRVLPLVDESRYDIAPMSGMQIIATSGDLRLEGRTDEKGLHEFTGIPPGKYSVRVVLSDNPDNDPKRQVNIVEHGCDAATFLNDTGGNIRGRVVDVNGQPAKNVKVDLIRLEDALAESPKGKWRFTMGDGSYELPEIPPGKYILGVNLIDGSSAQCPRARSFYINPNNALQAGYVEIKEKQELEDYDIQLLPGGIEQEVGGTVVWPDGKPALHASVQLTTGSPPYYLVGEQKGVNERGEFVLKGIAGCTYRINAFTYGGRTAPNSNVIEEQRHAEPIRIILREQKFPPFRLILTSPGFMHRDDEQRRPRK
jgi:hypothetical protein